MKNLLKKYYKFFVFVIMSVCYFSYSYAQEELIEPYLELSYTKKVDGQKLLIGKLTNYINRQEVPIVNAEINFYFADSLITQIPTDEKGEAVLLISNDYKIPKDEEGRYPGSGS